MPLNNSYKAIALVVFVTLGAARAVEAAQPAGAILSQIEVAGWTIDVVAGPNKDDRSLRIVARCSAGTWRYVLPGIMQAVKDVVVHSTRSFIVVGDASPATSIAILDLGTSQVVDAFVVQEWAISPDGRFIAFTEFFPPSTPIETSIYLLYDVTMVPGMNRMGTAASSGTAEAGRAVYPTESRNALSYGFRPFYSDNREHRLNSPLTWVSPTDLVFVDYYPVAGRARLARVETSQGLDRTRLQEIDMAPANLVDVMRMPPGADPSARIRASSISLSNRNGTSILVSVRFEPGMGVSTSTATFRFPPLR